ncbi:MAG TPA: DmsC/YnfH family molybdoenzyme membrane anchor subunit [Bacteroidales bacterium]|nr:DmsC/YnfH family molybdoenzyme membrane anchor subunit [Bacteroidales bacterium]
MDYGFIFDHNRCVDCKACSAACILENGWQNSMRSVFIFNAARLPELPVVNLSMACNHCGKAICLDGCPSGAIYRHDLTGAVVVDETKCLGCKYCQWNCPYDAPEFDNGKRTISKCHLCYNGFAEGRAPACASACPTGALSFGKISDKAKRKIFSWFPDKKLEPSLRFTGKDYGNRPSVVPGELFHSQMKPAAQRDRHLKGIWVLVLFSFIVTLSVSYVITSLFEGTFPDQWIFFPAIVVAGLISLLHLGHPERAWKAPLNIKTSPLSREITAFIIYAILSFIAVLLRIPAVLLAASAAGLILLILIDAVYYFSDRSRRIILHGGQTFLSALLMVSFLTRNVLPFTFIALLKLSASFYNMASLKNTGAYFGLRFMRFAILLITGVILVSGRFVISEVVIISFFTGELIDRILYYVDFNPVNINDMILNNEITYSNETKRN